MDEYEFPTETLEVFRWAQRFWKKAMSKGCQCTYKKVNVYTEFTGSTCAESAVEAVVSAMKPSEKPEVYFGSAADIKPACRKVAMSTRTLACAYCSIWVYECDMSCLMTFWFVSPCSHPRSELLLLWRHAGHLARQYGDIHQCSGKRGGKHLSIKMWHCITATCSIQVCHVAAGCSIMYHTFTISYVYIYIFIFVFSPSTSSRIHAGIPCRYESLLEIYSHWIRSTAKTDSRPSKNSLQMMALWKSMLEVPIKAGDWFVWKTQK